MLRLAVLTNRDIESCVALNLLHRALGARIGAVFLSERVGGKGPVSRALEPLSFLEQDFFTRHVFPAVERTPTTGRFLTFAEFERVHGIPVRALASARTTDALDALRTARADLFVSIRFGHILGEDAIAIPPRGVLNLHSGLLPQYRGVIATFRALLNGDDTIGCTLHWIDSPSIDAGAILEMPRVTVDRSQSLLWHILALYPPGMHAMERAVLALETDRALPTKPQDPNAGAYYSFPTDADVAQFTAAGWRLFGRDDVDALMARFAPAS
ncbi:MAG TPA: formyltransferase family protein [Gemmatimonadaceae bacterium]|jgi:methionyl-tRNA formyltransferase